jgi:hypothetical protein
MLVRDVLQSREALIFTLEDLPAGLENKGNPSRWRVGRREKWQI